MTTLREKVIKIGAKGGDFRYGYENKIQYMRLSAGDQSEIYIDSNKPSLTFVAGLKLKPLRQRTLRAGLDSDGAWFSRIDYSYAYSAGNTSHYPEFAWTQEPSYGQVQSAVHTATDSYSWSSHSLSGLFSLEYAPATNVVLFTLVRLGFSKTITVFDVYNAPDGKIWEETSKASLSMASSTGEDIGMKEIGKAKVKMIST
jgi:hypothetical protein